MKRLAIRGSIFHTTENPADNPSAWDYLPDGVMLITNGLVERVMPAEHFTDDMAATTLVHEIRDGLICPGFVDAHVHYSQMRIIASPAAELLEWLEIHTFPEESRFSDPNYAAKIAVEFFDEIVRNGTTSALVYPTVHTVSVDSFFEESCQRGMRMVAGKVLMDQNAPKELCDGNDAGYKSSRALINKWHEHGRQTFAVTPRFAGTSSRKQLQVCKQLLEENDSVLLHTHLSETLDEIEWTLSLFTEFDDYLGVYDGFGLVSDRSLFAHCIHLKQNECQRIADAGATAVLCPTSNLFLGSGLVRPKQLAKYGINTALGTDVGGGTSLSMLQTMQELYKVSCHSRETLTSFELFYLATLGGARALKIDQYVGSFEPGKEADFIVLDSGNSKFMKQRLERTDNIKDKLFVFAIMGNTANVRETWSMGRKVYAREELNP